MKSLDCNQIKIFINLEIIGEEEIKKKKLYLFFLKYKKNFCNLVQSLGATTTFKPNFYYIVYEIYIKDKNPILHHKHRCQIKQATSFLNYS